MSNHTREVVTLQLGHYANYVGTHWWNIQESSFVYVQTPSSAPKEVRHDVLFREGYTLSGEVTYTPRLVAVDLKGSLNTLQQDGKLYEVEGNEEDLQWHSDVTLHKTEPANKNEFLRDLEKQEELYLHGKISPDPAPGTSQDEPDVETDETEEEAKKDITDVAQQVFGTKLYNLDSKVKVWSDFLRPHLHPKSVHIVEQYQHGNELVPFDNYFLGDEVYKDHRSHSEIEDRLHFFLEECDHLQGIQLLVDPADGFGGLASSVIEELTEDYSNKGLMVCAVHPPVSNSTTPHQDCCKVLNCALAYEKLVSHSSLLVPMSLAGELWRVPKQPASFKHLTYKPDLHYHTSAILAACLDTMSLPYRLETNSSLMTHMTQALAPLGRNVSCLQASLPFPVMESGTLSDALMSLGDSLPWQPLTPMCSRTVIPDCQSVVLRGIPNSRLKGPVGPQMPRALSQCTNIEELVQLYLTEQSMGVSAVCGLEQPMKTTAPFPHIFSEDVSSTGGLGTKPRSQSTGVDGVPIITSLQSSTSVGALLDQLVTESGKLNLKKYHKYLEAGLEEDDFKETLSSLMTLRQTYETGGGDMA